MGARFAPLVAVFFLAACGDPAPVEVWNVNLNAQCEPADPVDSLRALLTPQTFWNEQVWDMEIRVRASVRNLEGSRNLLRENRQGRGQFRGMVAQRARELNLSGTAAQSMAAENMEEFDALAETFDANIEKHRVELAWARKCLARAQEELRASR